MPAIGFDPQSVPAEPEFATLPVGKYLALITNSDRKQNGQSANDPNGSRHEFEWEVLDGPHGGCEAKYKGRKLWSRHNTINKNADAQRIAQREVKNIMEACNMLHAKETVELHGIPVVIHVKCRKRQDNGEMQNEIKKVERKTPESWPAAPAASGQAPPWQRS